MVTTFAIFATLVFGATGAVFAAAALSGEGSPFLTGPAVFSLLVAASIGLQRRGRLVRALAVATGVYDLTVLVGQVYFAVVLWQLRGTIFAAAAIAGYAIATLLFIGLLPALYVRLAPVVSLAPPDETRRKSTRTSP